jgi:hypothetical protein
MVEGRSVWISFGFKLPTLELVDKVEFEPDLEGWGIFRMGEDSDMN